MPLYAKRFLLLAGMILILLLIIHQFGTDSIKEEPPPMAAPNVASRPQEPPRQRSQGRNRTPPRKKMEADPPAKEGVHPSTSRFIVRWGAPGLCGSRSYAKVARTRDRILRSFVSTETDSLTIRHDSTVHQHMLQIVARGIASGNKRFAELSGLDTTSPDVYVYANLAQLRSSACVNQSAIAYYDGAIHIVASEEYRDYQIHESAIHEFVHHALNQHGVPEPMWLHEGLAMHLATEMWWADSTYGLREWIQTNHFPFLSMVKAFPHTSDEQFATAAYYQSFEMVRAILWLRNKAALAEVIHALREKRIDPNDAFAFGLDADTQEDIEYEWMRYLKENGN